MEKGFFVCFFYISDIESLKAIDVNTTINNTIFGFLQKKRKKQINKNNSCLQIK
jgi:hypothetical protein